MRFSEHIEVSRPARGLLIGKSIGQVVAACSARSRKKPLSPLTFPEAALSLQTASSHTTDWSVLDPTPGCFVERGELEREQLPQPLFARDGWAAETVD